MAVKGINFLRVLGGSGYSGGKRSSTPNGFAESARHPHDLDPCKCLDMCTWEPLNARALAPLPQRRYWHRHDSASAAATTKNKMTIINII